MSNYANNPDSVLGLHFRRVLRDGMRWTGIWASPEGERDIVVIPNWFTGVSAAFIDRALHALHTS